MWCGGAMGYEGREGGKGRAGGERVWRVNGNGNNTRSRGNECVCVCVFGGGGEGRRGRVCAKGRVLKWARVPLEVRDRFGTCCTPQPQPLAAADWAHSFPKGFSYPFHRCLSWSAAGARGGRACRTPPCRPGCRPSGSPRNSNSPCSPLGTSTCVGRKREIPEGQREDRIRRAVLAPTGN